MFEISMLGMFFTAFWLLAQPASNIRRGEWWVEIVTDLPRCTYYFGPFDTDKEASSNIPGYVEDLESESAKRLSIRIKRCQPSELTICDSEFSEGIAA